MARRLLAIAALAATTLALVQIVRREPAPHAGTPGRGAAAPRASAGAPTTGTATPRPSAAATPRPNAHPAPKRQPRIRWRDSRALGTPSAGRLVDAVRLPARGKHFLTWDPVRKRTPNRWTRRNGTDDLVRTLLSVAKRHDGPILIGDLSRPHGGDFGRRYGPIGHASHQNGLDADVYFPRKDGKPRAPRTLDQVDRAKAQDLVDRFVRAGASKIFVGAGLRLKGPAAVVQPWPNHDDHLHVRL
jgi:penicillin-insensitive murein endopeptidase